MGCPLNHRLFRSITAFSASSSLRNYKRASRKIVSEGKNNLQFRCKGKIHSIASAGVISDSAPTLTYTFPTRWSPRLSHMFISSTSPYFSSISVKTSCERRRGKQCHLERKCFKLFHGAIIIMSTGRHTETMRRAGYLKKIIEVLLHLCVTDGT